MEKMAFSALSIHRSKHNSHDLIQMGLHMSQKLKFVMCDYVYSAGVCFKIQLLKIYPRHMCVVHGHSVRSVNPVLD